MLDDRAKLLLKALVERYIADGTPVGSRTLSRASGLELSFAGCIENAWNEVRDRDWVANPQNGITA